MANSHKGEVAFEAGGKNWTLRLGADEICNAEAEVDLGISEMIDRLQRGANFRICRALLRAGAGATAEDANAIIREIGLGSARELVAEAITLAFPPPNGETEGKAARPRRGGEAGTGTPS